MSMRGFGIQTLGASAQPAFGTTLTAAVTPTPDRHTGTYDPRSQPSYATLAVTAASWFKTGDKVAIGTAANFGFNPVQHPDFGSVATAPNYVGNTVAVSGLTRAHASGEFVVLCINVATLIIAPLDTNTGVFYIGPDSSVGAASTSLGYQITKAAAALEAQYALGRDAVGNTFDTGAYWVTSTVSGDKYLPMIITI